MDAASRFSLQIWNLDVLPVPAAVSAATAVEPATSTAVEPAGAAAESAGAAAESAGAAAAVEPAASVEAMIAAPEAAVVEASASAKAAFPAIEPMSPKAAITEVAIAETETMEPWSGAYKQTTHKVVWTVVAVRRTRVWVIPVVAVGAHRSRTVVARTNSNANRNLRM